MAATDAEKLLMFENRLRKVWKHYAKIARKQDTSCFRFYDHDLPEAPLAIEWYEGAVHVAEYKRRHGMEDEAHAAWLQAAEEVISRVVEVPREAIFVKVRQRKAGRQGQYEKQGEQKVERIVREGGLSF